MMNQSLEPSILPAAAPTGSAGSLRRSVGAVLAGMLAIFTLTTATDALLHATAVFPRRGAPPMSNALFLLAFAYRFVFDVGGCYLTGRLAPQRPTFHALVLGSIGVVLSLAGAIAMWDEGPAWYGLGLAASALPCGWLGGIAARGKSVPR